MKMNDLILSGLGTALVTPFKEGEVDYQAYRRLVERQLAAGVDFLVPLGTTGETPCLEEMEKVRILDITAGMLEGTKPMVAGVGTNSLKATLSNMKLLENHGVDAFLVVVPYYNKPTQRGQYEYFKAIASETDKPIIIYNVPGRTGANMQAETTLRLAEIDNIIAVKEASGNLEQIYSVIKGAPEGFAVLSGNDDQTLDIMRAGGAGIISVASNVAPDLMVQFVATIKAAKAAAGVAVGTALGSAFGAAAGSAAGVAVGTALGSAFGAAFGTSDEAAAGAADWTEAEKFNEKLMPLFKACFYESNPIPAKAALAAMGLIDNELRLPLVPCEPATMTAVKKVLRSLGLL